MTQLIFKKWKKWTFALASLALLTTLLIPWHYHSKGTLNETTQSHCSVCHLQTTARATTSTKEAPYLHFLDEGLSIQQICLSHISLFSVSSASPRAPPTTV